ncbi:Na+/H+ antiporter subunit E [Anaerosolibacter sp.]|uniref:Na+/H+ antiporter subunit E n=1 Tax=Anaerosolibacter sp. TaxID=1872527 RepID=UPI0039F1260D
MTRITLTSLLTIGFWIVLSERLNLEVLVAGLLLISIMYMLYGKRKVAIEHEKTFFIKSLGNYGKYLWILVKEIIAANLQVAKIVLGPRISISPTMITYETKLESAFHRTVFANSITLTPGTLTVSMVDNILTIHCLKGEYGEQIMDSKLEKILLEIEEYQR